MPPQNAAISNAPVLTPKIGKFKASRMIVGQSWSVLKQDKEMMWFPVLSAILNLAFFVLMAAIFYFAFISGQSVSTTEVSPAANIFSYVVVFVYYVGTYFIMSIFEAGIFIVANARFSGQDLTFSSGISGAWQHAGKIFTWALICATVGTILNFISNQSKTVGKIIAGILGAAWQIMTYFSLLSLIIGQTSVKDSFKESASIIRKMWGEALIMNFTMGLFFGGIVLIGFIIAGVIVVMAHNFAIMVIVGALLLIFLVMISIISTTLNSIFKLALYQYARTGNVPQGFSPELVQNAVKR